MSPEPGEQGSVTHRNFPRDGPGARREFGLRATNDEQQKKSRKVGKSNILGRRAHEQECREALARTPEGDRAGVTSPTDTVFIYDKPAYPSPKG